MMYRAKNIFKTAKPCIIGMLHLKALPARGSTLPVSKRVFYSMEQGYQTLYRQQKVLMNFGNKSKMMKPPIQLQKGTPGNSSTINSLIYQAVKEAEIYRSCNVDSVLIENMHDVPYVQPDLLGPEIVATMTRVCSEIRHSLPESVSCGVQILAGGNKEAIAVAQAANLQFIRAEGFVFSHIADEGLMNSCAGQLLRYRKHIGAENIYVFTDIKKKHCSHSITNDITVEETAKASEFFLSDGVILTGRATGDPANAKDIALVRKSCSLPIFIGSGVTADNVSDYLDADALIIGSYFKRNGDWRNEVDKERVEKFMNNLESSKQSHEAKS